MTRLRKKRNGSETTSRPKENLTTTRQTRPRYFSTTKRREMKAEEARKLVIEYESRSDISGVLAEIKANARVGKTILKIAGSLTTGQIEALQALGYMVLNTNEIIW